MRYAKLNADSTLSFPPLWVIHGEQQIFNPSADVLNALGYKPVIEAPYPAQDEDTEPIFYAARYEEREGKIVQVWEEAQPHNDQADAEA